MDVSSTAQNKHCGDAGVGHCEGVSLVRYGERRGVEAKFPSCTKSIGGALVALAWSDETDFADFWERNTSQGSLDTRSVVGLC